MKIRKAKMMWGSLCVIASLILILCIVNLYHYLVQDNHAAAAGHYQSGTDGQQNFYDERYTYAYDTCYTGDPYLSDSLFRDPFKRTDKYVNNNDFIAAIGEENADMLAKKSKEAMLAIFDASYQERDTKDPVLSDILIDGLHVLFADGTMTDSKEDTIEAINSWFIDSHTSLEADFYTDKCMVFYDEAKAIVRGQLVFTVYGGNDMDTLKEYFGKELLEQGKEYAVILELEYISHTNANDYGTYKLSGISKL